MKRRFALAGVVALIATLTGVVSSDVEVASANPVPVQFGFVPLPADQFQAVMEASNSAADTTLDFTVGFTSAGAGAVVTYDEWEDGYEADLANPVQATTQVWGDGNASNGDSALLCSACAGDLVPQGAVITGRNNITTPRNPLQIRYDGRDQVASTRGFALTAAGFSTPLGSVLSGAVSAFDTTKYGTDYVVPVGEDTAAPMGTSPAFEYTAAVIMAAENSTTVQVDLDGNGTFDQSSNINKGQVVFVDGGLDEGAHIVSSKPVQVHLGTGDVGAAYESRWFTLFPTELLSSDYLNPVGSSDDNQRTIVYLHNPNASAITVTPTCTSCAGTIPIPGRSTVSFTTPLGEAVRFASVGGQVFNGIGAAGAQSGAAPGSGTDNSSVYDWGYTLVPTGLLATQAILSWAPGNSTDPPSAEGAAGDDDNPVWVTSLTATTLHVDYDGDPTTGAIASADCFGARHDSDIAVGALASTRITDASDNDMTGARIYTCDSTKIAGAWGEDPANAPMGSPGFDAGYTLIPSTTMIVDKSNVIFDDANSDGMAGPGDTLQYEVSILDAGSLAFTNVEATDILPPGTSFVSGSAEFDDGTVTPIADDTGIAHTTFPFDEGGLALPDVAAGDTVYIRYKLAIDHPFLAPGNTLTNTVDVTSNEATGTDTNVETLAVSDLSLTKSAVVSPVKPGDNGVFRLTLSNAGPDVAAGVAVTDLLPAGMTFVSANAAQGVYVDSSGLWTIGTLANGASTTLDITAKVNELSTTNYAQVSASGSVDPDSQPLENALDETHPPDQDDEAAASLTMLSTSVLGDTVWNDADADGVVDAGENGIEGVDLAVTGAGADGSFGTGDDTTATRTTDSLGNWSRTGLPGGNYRVTVDTSSLPSGVTEQTHDFDGVSSANVATVALDAAETRNDLDFGYRTPPPTWYDVTIKNELIGTLHKGNTPKYILTVINNGPADSASLLVTDVLPNGVTYVSATGDGWSCSNIGQTVSCVRAAGLVNGESSLIDLNVRVTGNVGSHAVNHAIVTGEGDVDLTNNEASVAAGVMARTGFEIVMWTIIGIGLSLVGLALLMAAAGIRRAWRASK